MRFPPLRLVFQEGRLSFLRFSTVLLVAAAGTLAALTLMERTEAPNWVLVQILTRILLTAVLGIPLLTALTVASERTGLSALGRTILPVCGVVFLVLYYLLLPEWLTNAPLAYLIRWAALLAAFHLLVSFAPFIRRNEISQFWEFNKILFLRLLTALLFTFVLWAGLSIALFAIQQLFGAHIPGERYAQLLALVLGVFNTWFFLAGIPHTVTELNAEQAYPRGLRVFAQFVLIPLVAIYLIILYAYTAKIIVDWDWPKGWVGNLVLGFSLSGLFALLLVHPIVRRTDNPLLRIFSRYYHAALLPMTILLFLAIYRRIAEYGITEARYYVLVLSLWLAGIVLYFLLSKSKSIKMIPFSLCAIALLSTFGPWSAQSVTVRSQKARLETLLAGHGMLADGRIQKPDGTVPFAHARQFSSILQHFTAVNGTEALQPLFAERLDSVQLGKDGKPIDTRQTAGHLADLMGVRYVESWDGSSADFCRLQAAASGTLSITGFDRMVRLNLPAYGDDPPLFRIGEDQWSVRYDRKLQRLVIARPGLPGDSAAFELTPFAQGMLHNESVMTKPASVAPELLSLDAFGRTMKLRLVFSHLVCDTRADSALFASGSATLLIGRVEQAQR